ncbi:hypothetical protein PF010_g4616 [Phytophthora fragariae]|uniref:Uncharacterized protein n=1 Tax=Phytophthora fragariae TaxID=53985 RepID=A0A6G0PJ75_9STRA|nr:hypothetical protein PF010_g4616 [Phytophthora fragariae]KAE9247655.1 hypothetical protein PF004_g4222 [Phytophthora fragariae]
MLLRPRLTCHCTRAGFAELYAYNVAYLSEVLVVGADPHVFYGNDSAAQFKFDKDKVAQTDADQCSLPRCHVNRGSALYDMWRYMYSDALENLA